MKLDPEIWAAIIGGLFLIASSSRKVKEGKIVKVDVEFDDVITSLRITGDFFMHPEDILEDIEKSMLGLKTDVNYEILVNNICEIVNYHDAQMIGVSPESLASVIREALK